MAQRPAHGNLTGVDTNGVNWSATFTLERGGGAYSGTFAWKRNGQDAGTESFTGMYDGTKKVVTFTGGEARGNVVPATYVATLSSDRARMTDGQWTSSRGPSGTWQAERATD